MTGRYTAEFLLHLRDSPLCVKPPGLPPAEEWMGPPPETFRNQTNKTTTDRSKGAGDSLLLGQENRRPALDRNGTRGAANPDEIILGPPRAAFPSSTSARNNRISSEVDKGAKDSDRQDRSDRFALRSRNADLDNATANDRYRDRDGRTTFRRRGDQDQDSEGWTPVVKGRKSFGNEGAERFHGRMGAAGERFGGRDDRRTRDRDERDTGDRRSRNLDGLRDKDGEDAEGSRRNGLARGKSEPWFRETANEGSNNDAPVSQRERIDRAKSWRDRDPDAGDRRGGDRANDNRSYNRWDRDRDQRVEREPEWLDEPVEEKTHGHTEEDFKKFMESMKSKKAGAQGAVLQEEKASATAEKATVETDTDLKAVSAPAVDAGPDKFFVAFGGGASLTPSTPAAESKDSASKTQKSSRFMAKFLTPQEDSRARTEPPTPAAAAQAGSSAPDYPPQNDTEKEAFAMLIQKLQRSGVGPAVQASGPPPQSLARLFEQHQPPVQLAQAVQETQPKHVASPEPFQQYGGEHREDPRMRAQHPQHQHHNMVSPRQMMPPTQAPPVSRPEQALHELLAQRHNLPSQGSNRGSQTSNPSNTEFLMRLMQSHRDPGEPQRPELQVRMPQPTKQVSLASIPDREADYQRERERLVAQRQQQQQQAQQQQMRQQQGPPGFLDDQFHSPEMDSRPQPTQILQRPPPPGLDHHGMHPFQIAGNGAGGPGNNQMPPAPQRPMIPPPGLVNGPRNPSMPNNMPNLPGMYPNNFPPPGPPYGAPPPPLEGLSGVPPGALPRMLPPPGFYGGVPPGFLPPGPPGMSPGGFHGGPDGPGGFPGAPFDRRGMLPPGYRGP
ncbi:hypothetical protein QBC34DRAFT_81132 [Podospora aff. communis PSN243]|uniref:Uncharacterized protein n=1 Tax=Podospora aff. communis PSN243 TaxID=3040156 RepID=A0AAV9GML1_9PEZI|nr:hypothetical protein QBC34DRAFT_81132 [Podospora aff. communis PSN243]